LLWKEAALVDRKWRGAIDAGSEAIKAAERLLPLRNLHLRVGRRAP